MSKVRKYLKDIRAHSESGMDQHLMAVALLSVLRLHEPQGRHPATQTCLGCHQGTPYPCSTVRVIEEVLK